MNTILRRAGLAALATGLTLGLATAMAPKADALTVSFTWRAFSQFGRANGGTSYSGEPVGSAAFNPSPLGDNRTAADHAALQLQYFTSGLPYVVESVVYTASSGVQFGAAPNSGVTIAAGLSTDPSTAPLLTTSTVTQNFTVNPVSVAGSDFQQGGNNPEVTYAQVYDSTGTTLLDADNSFGPFTGSMIMVNFRLVADPTNPFVADGSFATLPATFSLNATIGIQTTPPNDPLTLDYGEVGAFRELNPVPEPGSIALLVGAGVGGSMLLRRRRAR